MPAKYDRPDDKARRQSSNQREEHSHHGHSGGGWRRALKIKARIQFGTCRNTCKAKVPQ